MPITISGAIALIVAVFAIVHFGSTNPDSSGNEECTQEQVYRWSDRACYTPQGE